jgi:hypothetical protein
MNLSDLRVTVDIDQRPTNVRFGSLTDICSAKRHVRFTPNSDHESRHPANGHVCFTPESGHVRYAGSCPLWAISRYNKVRGRQLRRPLM